MEKDGESDSVEQCTVDTCESVARKRSLLPDPAEQTKRP